LVALIANGGFEFLDNYDMDTIAREMARNNGMPSTWLKDIKQRDKERTEKRARAEQQGMLDRAADLSKAAKNLSQKPEEGSITQEMINAAES